MLIMTPPRRFKFGKGVLGAEPRPFQVDVYDTRKLRRGELVDRLERGNGGIVDQNIQTAEVLHRTRDHVFDRRLIGDIRLDDHTPSPQGPDLLLGLRGSVHGQASDEEVRSLLGHGQSDGVADAA